MLDNEQQFPLRMQVRKVSGQPGTFRFVAVDPVGQINAVTP